MSFFAKRLEAVKNLGPVLALDCGDGRAESHNTPTPKKNSAYPKILAGIRQSSGSMIQVPNLGRRDNPRPKTNDMYRGYEVGRGHEFWIRTSIHAISAVNERSSESADSAR